MQSHQDPQRITYRKTRTNYYDGVTTRFYDQIGLTPDEASQELEKLSGQNALLYEALDRIRRCHRDLDRNTLLSMVNYAVLHIFHRDNGNGNVRKDIEKYERRLETLGFRIDRYFYDRTDGDDPLQWDHPHLLEEWLCPEEVSEKALEIIQEEQENQENAKLHGFLQENIGIIQDEIQAHQVSDHLSRYIERELDSLADAAEKKLPENRLRELAETLQEPLPEGAMESRSWLGSSGADAHASSETVLRRMLSHQHIPDSGTGWPGEQSIRQQAPDLFKAVRDVMMSYEPPDEFMDETQRELEHIARRVIGRIQREE